MTVELIGGRGEELWPWPGRVLAVGPSHSFSDLAEAVNTAFSRWDRSHLSLFTLADGRVVTDRETGAELASSAGGPVLAPLVIDETKVGAEVGPNDEFRYTFDLGDEWTHRCVVGEELVDPLEVLGIRPRQPLPYWGWGSIPDQYGRRWVDDDGSRPAPSRPRRPHPMLFHEWPGTGRVSEVDLREVRAAIATADADRFLAAVVGRNVDDVLQQVGAGIPMALELRRDQSEPLALSLVNRLAVRAGPGDQLLANDLLARLRHEPLEGREIHVDLDELSAHLETDPNISAGAYLDLSTGEVYGEGAADPAMVGEDVAIDVDAEPARWVWLEHGDSRDGWRDMADFAARQHETALREQLEGAIEGRGAFGRFRRLVHEEGLADRWNAFVADRQWGRARAILADRGIRAG